MSAVLDPPRTLAELHARVAGLAGVPPERVRVRPPPGTATEADLVALAESGEALCELIDGTLLEKPAGYRESQFGGYLLTLINTFVVARNLGIVLGEQGPNRIFAGRVRMPDVAFVSWDRFPGGAPTDEAVLSVAADLAVEVLSPSNTTTEMRGKRDDYFAAGTCLVWEIDPRARTAAVYTRPDAADAVLSAPAVLDGGSALPGFAVPLADLFAELDRRR